jgi:hypothetical protein
VVLLADVSNGLKIELAMKISLGIADFLSAKTV